MARAHARRGSPRGRGGFEAAPRRALRRRSTRSLRGCAQAAGCTTSAPAPADGSPRSTPPSARRRSASIRGWSRRTTPGTGDAEDDRRRGCERGDARHVGLRRRCRRGRSARRAGPPTCSAAVDEASARTARWSSGSAARRGRRWGARADLAIEIETGPEVIAGLDAAQGGHGAEGRPQHDQHRRLHAPRPHLPWPHGRGRRREREAAPPRRRSWSPTSPTREVPTAERAMTLSGGERQRQGRRPDAALPAQRGRGREPGSTSSRR